jgi:hypothetical protein
MRKSGSCDIKEVWERKRNMITYPSVKAGRSFLAWVTCLGLFCGVQLQAGGPPSAITVSKPVLVSDPPKLALLSP